MLLGCDDVKITVAIPCYNLEDRIVTCLESVISQDYQDVEILIIDDCSTDHSREVVNEIIRNHPERQFHFIINDINLGLNKVRNLAIQEAKGDCLFFVDGDDTIEPETLSMFHRRMEETHVDVVCGSFRRKDFDGNTYITKQFPSDTIIGDFAYASYIEKYIKGYFHIAVWNNLYRLNFLKSHDIYCSCNYRTYESSLFTFKVVLNAQSISFIQDVTYNYYDVPTSICHQKKDKEYLRTISAVKVSVIDAMRDCVVGHKYIQLPRGIWFLLHFICLTNGSLKDVMESNVSKREKKQFFKWLKETYRRNDMNWNTIVGPYNRISYLILVSPFSYPLFRFYFKHLKTVAKIVGYLTK